MNVILPTILQVLAALSCLGLGVIVLARNPYKRAHQAFAMLAINLGLWTIGVIFIINSDDVVYKGFWLRLTFIVASFIPATYQYFVGVFPDSRFEGYRWLMGILLACAAVTSAGAFTPWYIRELVVSPGQPTVLEYGPVFLVFAASVVLTMLFGFPLLLRKLRHASGVERRQLQHVLLGTAAFTVLATLTNVLGPSLGLRHIQAYGPIFLVLMMGTFAYAMVRYHLLDIWFIVSRTTVYAVATMFVAVVFLASISLVHWVFSSGAYEFQILPTFLAALVVVLVLEPIKEHMQLFLDRTVLKRRYDIHGLLARISQYASRIVQLDQLLGKVADDIRKTLGVEIIRVFLVDESDPGALIEEHASMESVEELSAHSYDLMLEYIRNHRAPVSLEEMVRSWPTEEHARVARQLAELDAYLCVPLMSTSRLVGILTLGQKATRDIYTTEDLVVFTALASPLATAIENARLYRELEEANIHRARILRNMRGGVVAVDTTGKVQTINQAATLLLGDIDLEEDLDAIPEPVCQVLRQSLETQRDVDDFETLLKRPDGREIPVAMSSSCLFSATSTLTGVMVMIYDLSQIKRLEQNVQRADRLSSLGTLAAGMAHEIKNPLVSIKTFAQLMPMRYEDKEFRETFADVVPHEVERIDSIVSRLLDFARPKPAQFARQDMSKVIAEVLILVENQASKSGITIQTEFPRDQLAAYGDEQQLHQVFLNLALNAIEAMEQTGPGVLRVRVRQGRMHLRRNRLAPLLDVECVRISLEDTGPGIPREHIDGIFTPFHTTKEHGSGLGLAVVHGIITEHGGQIDVRSEVNKGTVFTVTLPLAPGLASAEGM